VILYVLLVWLCAIGFVVLVELALISLPGGTGLSGGGFSALPSAAPLSAANTPLAIAFVWGAAVFILGLAAAYWCDVLQSPVHRLYLRLQRSYPPWYRRWPANGRELILACLLGLILLTGGALFAFLFQFQFPYWGALPAALGLGCGFLVRPVLRYRQLLVEDRPDTGPKAIIQKVAPAYSSERALLVGQIYLRFLLPVFSLLCLLILPLVLTHIEISALQGGLIFAGVFVGVGLGWFVHRESQLDIQHFRKNLFQLSSLALLSVGFLVFGFLSGNPVQMVLMGALGGYLAALY